MTMTNSYLPLPAEIHEMREIAFGKGHNGDACLWIVHAPDADAQIAVVGIHLNEELAVRRQGRGQFLEETLGQAVDSRAADADCGQAVKVGVRKVITIADHKGEAIIVAGAELVDLILKIVGKGPIHLFGAQRGPGDYKNQPSRIISHGRASRVPFFMVPGGKGIALAKWREQQKRGVRLKSRE